MSSIKQLTPGGIRYHVRRLFERSRAITLKGNTYYCNCCDSGFRSLLPAGIAHRPNARCPRCGSLERHRLIWKYLQQATDFFVLNRTVLDVAPEELMQRKLKALPNISYLSIPHKRMP
jgi:DNA-directed RNA polymerase subunit RPC12/RpoP